MGQYLHNEEWEESTSPIKTKNICSICEQDIISIHIGWGMRNLICRGKNTTCEQEAEARNLKEIQNSDEHKKLVAEYEKKRKEIGEKFPVKPPFFLRKDHPFSKEEVEDLKLQTGAALWQRLSAELPGAINLLEITEKKCEPELKLSFNPWFTDGYIEISMPLVFWWAWFGDMSINWNCFWQKFAKDTAGEFARLAVMEKIAEFFVEHFLTEKEKFDEILCAETREGRVQFKPDFGDRSNKRVVLYESAMRLSEEGTYGVYFEAPEIPLNRKDRRGSDMFKRRVKSFSKLY